MKNFNFMTLVATANKLENSKMVTGVKALIADGTSVLIGITAALTALLVGYNLVRYKTSDESDKPKFNKGWKSSLICGVAILLVESIVNVLFSYFL